MAGRGLAPTSPKHYSFFLVVARNELVSLDAVIHFFVKHKQLEEERLIEFWNHPSVNPGKKSELPFTAFSKFVHHAESVTFRELISPSDALVLIKEELERLGLDTQYEVGS